MENNNLLALISRKEREFSTILCQSISRLANIVFGYAAHYAAQTKLSEIVIHTLEQDKINAMLIRSILDKNADLQTSSTPEFLNFKGYDNFDQAINLIHKIDDDLWTNKFYKKIPFCEQQITELGGNQNSIQGTSILNALQIALLTALRVMTNASNLHMLIPFLGGNIYNIHDSPNIHTTQFPILFPFEEYSHIKEWFYYYKDDYSPLQGELMFTTLGYAYGGSRRDYRHRSKKLPIHDCSSALAEWLGVNNSFATTDMKIFYEEYDTVKSSTSLTTALSILRNSIKPIYDRSDVCSGDIVLFHSDSGGHTGIVTYIDSETVIFYSYARVIPIIEGFGIQQIRLDDANKVFYFFRVL
jgi:hypothetical protein